ncbi:Hypothetical predicted protein [Mytilus galloprovincialis]|uniref:Ig-like domain-containing protein n=1 Tax=Mytilus galloprovincialis TaxID=29158 RepID=A0A8B6FEC3_MYTGA|nr:Hypothetical predicted protein [Mytilus galloprovincialis]
MLNYKYFSKGETILLSCMSGAKTADWIGPAQNTTNPSLIEAVDDFGKQKIWQTTQYTNHRDINPNIHNFRRIRVVGTDSNGDFDLKISNASYYDIGLYRCAIDPVKGNPLTKSYVLQLKTPPSNLTIINETEKGTFIGNENHLLTLDCNVESGRPPETIYWKKERTILKTGGPRRNFYTFRPGRSDHNTNLTCEVTNAVLDRPLTKTVRLDIKYLPKVLMNPEQTMTVFERTNTKLCCEIDSNPNISFIFWSKDYKTIIDDAESSCLFLKNVTRQDSGNYTCLAGNEIGNGSDERSLIVFYPPSVYLEYKIFSVNESRRDIHCKGGGIPNNLTFSRVEHTSNFNEHIRFLEVSSDGIATLPFLNEIDRYQDTGVYSCSASNGVSDMEGNKFQRGEAQLVFDGPPVFAPDNKQLQYGEIGKPIEISVKVYTTSNITCHYMNAIGSVSPLESIRNISSKIVLMRIYFHGVYITVNGIEVTFHLANLHHFQTFNVTVCINRSTSSFIVEVRQLDYFPLEELSPQGIAIILLVTIIVILTAGMGIYLRHIKQQYSKRMITAINSQTFRTSVEESAQYMEVLNDSTIPNSSQENEIPMFSMVERTVVENRDTTLVSADQSSVSSDNDNSLSEHLDDGYEYPYTTLLVNIRTEDEHVYLRTRNSATLRNAAFERSSELTEEDVLPDGTKTHYCPNQRQANLNLNSDWNDSQETDNKCDQTFVHPKNKAVYINLLLKQ